MTQDNSYQDVLNEVSDAALAQRAQTGDKPALAILYERYLERVYRYFYARTGVVQMAEDLTAQTWLAVLESLPRYRERGTFAGWLFAIAARRFADACRSQPPAHADVDAGADPPDPAPLPEAVLAHAEQMAALAQGLRQLPPDRAQAIALHFFAGLDHQETAQAMGRSRIAVKSLIHRALRDLKERLEHE